MDAPLTIAATQPAGKVIVWVLLLAALVCVGGVIIYWVRNRMFSTTDDQAPSTGLLNELRRAHDRGILSDQEFRLARDRLLDGLSGKPRARQKLLRGEVYDDGTIRARPGFDLEGDRLPSGPSQSNRPPDSTG